MVVEVAGLKAPDGASARDYGLTLEQLRDPRSLLTVRPLLSSAIGDELGFSGESSGEQFNISGPFVMPINLSPRKDSEGEARLYFGIPELIEYHCLVGFHHSTTRNARCSDDDGPKS